MSDRQIVLDASRQTICCRLCRLEVRLPTPYTQDALMSTFEAFTPNHQDCQATPNVGHFSVRTGPNGAALKRDQDGLWWRWTPVGLPAPYAVYTVVPLPLMEATDALRQLIAEMDGLGYSDTVLSSQQATAALATEPVFA